MKLYNINMGRRKIRFFAELQIIFIEYIYIKHHQQEQQWIESES